MEIKHEIAFSGEIQGRATVANFNEVLDLIADFHRCGHVPNGISHVKQGTTRLYIPTISTSVCDPETLVDLYLKNPNAPKREIETFDGFHFELKSIDDETSDINFSYQTTGFELWARGDDRYVFWRGIRDMHEFRFQKYEDGHLIFRSMWGVTGFKVKVPSIVEWDIPKIWNEHVQDHFEKMEERLNELQEVINSIEF